MLPWVLLGLTIWIPAVYLEFPSNPLAHLERIADWSRTGQVSENTNWFKASYFLAYSLTSFGRHGSFEPFLTFYYFSMSMLLAWQNYRLALAMKLNAPGAFLFAALQLLAFGNGAFCYHRYYGLSSTIVSQIATIALVRIALIQLTPLNRPRETGGVVLAGTCLLLLVLFNHVQGQLITSISLVSIGLWWLSLHHRTALTYTIVIVAIGSAIITISGLQAPSSAFRMLQVAGWLNSVGSFDVLTDGSPARHRAMKLLGTFGVASGLLSMLMFRRNHPGAWLMAVPWVCLVLPITAYPLALYLQGSGPDFLLRLHSRGADYLTVFSRLLFAMPLALPFAWLFSECRASSRWAGLAPVVPLATIGMLLAWPVGGYNRVRLWQAWAVSRPTWNSGPSVNHQSPFGRWRPKAARKRSAAAAIVTCSENWASSPRHMPAGSSPIHPS